MSTSNSDYSFISDSEEEQLKTVSSAEYDLETKQHLEVLSSACNCNRLCYNRDVPEQWLKWLKVVRGLEMNVRKNNAIYLLSPSLTTEYTMKPVYVLPFIGIVCRTFFQRFWEFGHHQLKGMVADMKKRRIPEVKQHGNSGKVCRHGLRDEDRDQVIQFLGILSSKEGEAIATRTFKYFTQKGEVNNRMEVANQTLLPSHYSYSRLCERYNQEYPQNLVSTSTFRRIWKNSEFSSLKIRKPSSDVCDDCGIIRNQINFARSTSTQEYQLAAAAMENHKNQYRQCRTAYEQDIIDNRLVGSQLKCHSFDFQQVVAVPYKPQQPAQWYYWSPFKLYVFGIVDEGSRHHRHVLYSESQQGKGANQVVSILHSYLTAEGNTDQKVHLWADNCGGQNKNKTMIWYLAWAVMQGWCKELILCFQVKGHTRNSVDRGFAITKNELNRSELYIPDQYIDIINRSCKTDQTRIEAVSLLDDVGNKTIFRDWDHLFSPHMKPIQQIQSYHFFRFDSDRPGIVYVKRIPNDPWVEKNILKPKTQPDFLSLPLEPQQQKDLGLVKEKRHDMWAKYSKHVPEQFKDTWIYTKPESELIREVKSVKNDRSKKNRKNSLKETTDSEDSNSIAQDCIDPGATTPQQERSTAGAKKRGRPTGSLSKKNTEKGIVNQAR